MTSTQEVLGTGLCAYLAWASTLTAWKGAPQAECTQEGASNLHSTLSHVGHSEVAVRGFKANSASPPGVLPTADTFCQHQGNPEGFKTKNKQQKKKREREEEEEKEEKEAGRLRKRGGRMAAGWLKGLRLCAGQGGPTGFSEDFLTDSEGWVPEEGHPFTLDISFYREAVRTENVY